LATFSAFLGVKLGSLYVEKVTIKTLQKAIAVLLGIIAIALGSGFLDTVNLRKE
jgi:uncharacterized membrane protein YfcA